MVKISVKKKKIAFLFKTEQLQILRIAYEKLFFVL